MVEATNASLLLPDTGNYHLMVGSVRGKATFDLAVEILGTRLPPGPGGTASCLPS